MGTIYQRGSRFYISYTDRTTGCRVRRSAGHSRLEALAELQKLEGTPEGGSFEALVSSYLESIRVHAKRRSVIVAESSCRRLQAAFGGLGAEGLSPGALDAFIKSRRAEGVLDRTINGDLIVLRAIVNHAVEMGLVQQLPVKVRLLKVSKKRILPILSKADIDRLLERAREPWYGILLISSVTAWRLDEVLHLTWRDVLFDEGKLTVTAKNGWTPKTYEQRFCYVNEEIIEYLKRRRDSARFNGDEDYVFGTRNNTVISVTNACRALRKVFQAAGLYRKGAPLTHWIRHSVCSRLLEVADVATVQRIMGHANASTTFLYAQSSDERMKKALARLNS